MAGVTSLAPYAIAWGATALAIAGLYLLRPRSRRVEVSSILLWQRVLEPASTRSPLTWLRRHLLLILQIATALLAAFALMRPASTTVEPVGRHIALIIDVSAPMLATDGDPSIVASSPLVRQQGCLRSGVCSRLDEARARGALVLGRLRAGDIATVISVGGTAQVEATGTIPNASGALSDAVTRLIARPSEANFAQALELASSTIYDAKQGEVLIITGGVADVTGSVRRPSVPIQVARVGGRPPPGLAGTDNVAITAFAARRDLALGGTTLSRSGAGSTANLPAPSQSAIDGAQAGPTSGSVQLFTRVTNHGTQTVNGVLRLKVDGKPFGERPMTIGGVQSEDVAIAQVPPDATWLEAYFDHNDLLAIDNIAWAAVPRPVERRVALVGSRTDQLERALRAVPGVTLERIDPARYDPNARYDIVVFEAWFPRVAPLAHWLLIDPPRTDGPVVVNGVLGRRTEGAREWNAAQIARVRPSPLLQGVDLAGVSIAEARLVTLPSWGEEVVSTRTSPLIVQGYPGAYRAVVVGFDVRSSNFLARVGFPIFVANTIEWLTGGLETGAALCGTTPCVASTTNSGGSGRAATNFVPGDALMITPLPRTTQLTVETPATQVRSYPVDPLRRTTRFLDTTAPGAYVIREYEGATEIARQVAIARAIPTGRELSLSDLSFRPAVLALASVGIGSVPGPLIAGPGETSTRNEWWTLLAACALGVLVIEWWWVHRYNRPSSRRTPETVRGAGAMSGRGADA